MSSHIALISLVVRNYDEAISFYTQILGFELVEDTPLEPPKRWVVVRPSAGSCGLLLAQANNDQQLARVGNQTGGRVFLFLHTDQFDRDYQNLLTHSVKIVRQPEQQPYGKVAVFEDLYGNKWDLIEPCS